MAKVTLSPFIYSTKKFAIIVLKIRESYHENRCELGAGCGRAAELPEGGRQLARLPQQVSAARHSLRRHGPRN